MILLSCKVRAFLLLINQPKLYTAVCLRQKYEDGSVLYSVFVYQSGISLSSYVISKMRRQLNLGGI